MIPFLGLRTFCFITWCWVINWLNHSYHVSDNWPLISSFPNFYFLILSPNSRVWITNSWSTLWMDPIVTPFAFMRAFPHTASSVLVGSLTMPFTTLTFSLVIDEASWVANVWPNDIATFVDCFLSYWKSIHWKAIWLCLQHVPSFLDARFSSICQRMYLNREWSSLIASSPCGVAMHSSEPIHCCANSWKLPIIRCSCMCLWLKMIGCECHWEKAPEGKSRDGHIARRVPSETFGRSLIPLTRHMVLLSPALTRSVRPRFFPLWQSLCEATVFDFVDSSIVFAFYVPLLLVYCFLCFVSFVCLMSNPCLEHNKKS